MQLVLAIDDLHKKGIMHRNINSDTVYVESDGYIKLADYHHARRLNDDEEAVDRPPCSHEHAYYRPPEMMMNEAHTKIVDWWSFGILIYKLIIGVTPFSAKDKKQLVTQLRTKNVVFPSKKKYNIAYSDEIVNLIQNLLRKKQYERLGSAEEVLLHPFFKDISKEQISEK